MDLAYRIALSWVHSPAFPKVARPIEERGIPRLEHELLDREIQPAGIADRLETL
jgi:hypothetical protein